MPSTKLQAALSTNGLQIWLEKGRNLTDYQKLTLKKEGISLKKYTAILFTESDPKLSDLKKICKIIGISIKEIL